MFFLRNREIPLNDIFTNNFVDIHSHLLPCIDDGAKSLQNSIELISIMSSYGIKKIITTPHVLGDVYPNSSEKITEKTKEVKNELRRQNITDISFRSSAEYMLDEQFLNRLHKKDILPLKDDLILVEMSYFNPPFNLYEILFDIQLNGYRPILAHPERYNFYHNDFESYYKLKKSGCLLQLNLLSLTGYYGKNVLRVTDRLLKENLYDFVGTDAHHQNHLGLLKKIATVKNLKRLKHLIQNNSNTF